VQVPKNTKTKPWENPQRVFSCTEVCINPQTCDFRASAPLSSTTTQSAAAAPAPPAAAAGAGADGEDVAPQGCPSLVTSNKPTLGRQYTHTNTVG
jgi:hypothetical protein